MDTELSKILEYKTFKDWGMRPLPLGYKKITAYVVFDIKYNGHKRARLVGGGHLTDPTDDVSYLGIASLCIICLVIFISMLNNLEICCNNLKHISSNELKY